MKLKKILLVHNYYKEKGGEDNVYSNELSLLQSHSSSFETRSLTLINGNSLIRNLKGLLGYIFPFISRKNNTKVIKGYCSLDLIHIHNFHFQFTPSFFESCQSLNVPVVHTLHNFRIICPTATLMYNNRLCERSLYGSTRWALSKKVYRNSFFHTFFLCRSIEYYKKKKTWNNNVDRYIALTEFAKKKYIEAGLPAEKITVKPNFIEDPHDGIQQLNHRRKHGLFVGRLSEEKGIDVLLKAWEKVDYPLIIVGGGPLESLVKQAAESTPNIHYLGFQNKEKIYPLLQDADFLIMASTWYEGFPMVLLEAFANGTPALVSNIGGMAEVVDNERLGLHFQVGDHHDLAKKANFLIANSNIVNEYGENARQEYLKKYTPERNLELLLDIYKKTISDKHDGKRVSS
ncbi:glycosyltransferase family 4 protein [Shewanella sp. 202IG2-18]|uniref:glycosyltransferase family 4 protein n=1 Tax=Parashewanella hymeniacidonis TaxID=2807618 RepID=UPI001960CDAA|nr:glycosyltransferase family 4 protein [Parashewanella hymeniacidonis]MBM7072034.1 glycosyltransferase family 4 protein [Parashewanella hymeniacidonis]